MNYINNFRLISFIEGISYIILVFIAMPLKYLGGNLSIVKQFGMLHGVLFILFVLLFAIFSKKKKISRELTIDIFVYSLVPFGFLLIERVVRKFEYSGLSFKK